MKITLRFVILGALAIGVLGCVGVGNKRTEVATPPRGGQSTPVQGKRVTASHPSAPLVTGTAPSFAAEAVMPDNTFATVQLEAFRGKYVILFFYPMDFTFVCPTEIIAFDEKLEEFKERNCEVIGVSVDSQFTHLAWKKTPRDKGGIGSIRYPLVADVTKSISRSYGVLWNESVALRGLFLIDTAGKVRHATINDLQLGRNVQEVLRTVDALLFVETHGDEVCPANWRPGQQTVKTTFEGIADYLSDKEKRTNK
jgi:peroxiredoxin (alkyl hydroperoxide reductase subunit C)